MVANKLQFSMLRTHPYHTAVSNFRKNSVCVQNRRGPFVTSVKRYISTVAEKYLLDLGFSIDSASSMLRAFPSGKNTSVSELQAMGKEGLRSLAVAVESEVEQKRKEATADRVKVVLKVPHDGRKIALTALSGDTFFDLHQRNREVNEAMECACKGIAACSTCHIIVDPEYYNKLPPPEENELDMLDLAWGPTDTSRLGCQIKLTKELDGFTASLPKQTNNLF